MDKFFLCNVEAEWALGTNNNFFFQAEFSFVNWPFSVKLLWAPIVDALFWPTFGRRKTWLVPVQYLIGIVMIIMSNSVQDWLGSESEPPSMMILTMSFLMLNFLAATQDIAVDGWALTMLKRYILIALNYVFNKLLFINCYRQARFHLMLNDMPAHVK